MTVVASGSRKRGNGTGHHTIVTFWRDKSSYNDHIPANVQHISINPLFLRIPQLLRVYFLIQKFSSSDRV